MYILIGGPSYGATTQIYDAWAALPERDGGGTTSGPVVNGVRGKRSAYWAYISGTTFSYYATISSLCSSTMRRAFNVCNAENFYYDLRYNATNGYVLRSCSNASTFTVTLASGLTMSPRRSTGDGGNTHFYVSGNKIYAYALSTSADLEDSSYIDIEVSGLSDLQEATITDYGSADPSRFEIVNRRFVRVYLFGANAMLGDCSITIGARTPSTRLLVARQSTKPEYAEEAKGVGVLTAACTLANGNPYAIEGTTVAATGVTEFVVPAGASCTVSCSIAAANASLWSLYENDSGVVAQIASAEDRDSEDPLVVPMSLYRKDLYFVVDATASGAGGTLAVTSPASPDGEIEHGGMTVPGYAEGRNIVVTATPDDEETSLSSVALLDENQSTVATYGPSQIVDGSITIRGLSENYYTSGTFATKTYAVAAEADEASSSAFSALSVTADGSPVSAVEKGADVTFAATMATGYSFEGWYLNGEKVSSEASVTREIAEAETLVAKAKVSCVLRLATADTATLRVDAAAYTPGTSFDVTLGDSFTYALTPASSSLFFTGWKDTATGTRVSLGRAGTVAPTAAIDYTAYVGEVDPTAPVYISVAYVDGDDSQKGNIEIEGEAGTTVEKEFDPEGTVRIIATPRNGWLFVGWFDNQRGQGAPISTSAALDVELVASQSFFARFDRDNHSVYEWEGDSAPKILVWRSKTYAASKPFNPSSCRVDSLGYVGDGKGTELELTVDMFSAPDSAPTATTTLDNIASQDARRLPVRRMERYMQVEVKANVEIDTLLVGTSMGGLAT